MKSVACIAMAVLLLAGCEGEQGPVGPMGPQGDPGQNGSGVVAVYWWQNEDPIPSSSYEITLPGWQPLQSDEFAIFQAYASVAIGSLEGAVELPMITIGPSGHDQQSSAVVGEGGSVTFVNLQGWYVYCSMTVVRVSD